MTQKKLVSCVFVLSTLCLVNISQTESAPMPSSQSNSYYSNELEEVPDDILMELIARFGQTIMRARNDLENSKRTVDFGLTRGYPGSAEARHRMGIASANSPEGPGRRRRSEIEV